jgi:iron complex outermembrane recepter protein
MSRVPAIRTKHSMSALVCGALILAATGAVSMIPSPAFAQNANPAQGNFDIPAQPLANALITFGRQSGLQVTAQGPLVEGRSSSAIQGSYSPAEALSRLLTGTGLTYRFEGNDAVRLEPAPTAPTGAIQLGPVRVESAGESDDTRQWQDRTLSRGAVLRPVTDLRAEDAAVGSYLDVPLQEQPRAITVIGAEQIQNQMAFTRSDILRNVPGVTVDSNALSYNETFKVRGFGGTIFVDNVLTATYGAGLPIEMFDRVEVLKGVSALQFGFFASPGGAANYRLRRPEANEFTRLDLTGTHYGELRLFGDYNMPIGDGNGLRFYGGYTRLRSYYNELGTGQRTSLGTAGTWMVTPTTRLDADVQYFDVTAPYEPVVYFFGSDPEPLPRLSRKHGLSQDWAASSDKGWSGSVRINQELADNWSVDLVGRVERAKRDALAIFIFDPDLTTGEAVQSVFQSRSNKEPIHGLDLRLKGNFDALGMHHEFAIGGTIARARYNYATFEAPYIDYDYAPYLDQNIFNPRRYPRPETPGTITPANQRQDRTQNDGLYIQHRASIGEMVDIWLGLRHTEYRYRYSEEGVVDPASVQNLGKVSPATSLVYKPVNGLTLYASYAEALQVGGRAPDFATNAGELMPAGVSKQFELGSKWDFGSGTIELAAFQIRRPLEYVDSNSTYIQSGLQVHKGIELTASGRITPQLVVQGGVSYVRAIQKDTGDPALDGQPAANVPETNASFYVEYSPLWANGITLTGGVHHSGSSPFRAYSAFDVSGSTTFDAGARYHTEFGGRATVFRVLVENLTNEYHLTADTFGGVLPNAPRTLKASIGVEF